METYPNKGHTAYDLPKENYLFGYDPYTYYKVIRKDNKKEYCLRVLQDSTRRDEYDKDVKILLEANHPFIVKYIDHFTIDGTRGLCIVTDCKSSRLSDLSNERKKIFS